MKFYFITFRSITFAQRGEGELRRKGIPCTLQRTPRWMEERGCGYCLRVRQRDAGEAVGILQREQLPFSKVYVQRPEGTVEALEL